MNRTADQLKPGETAVIKCLQEGPANQKLLELGCLPGEEITYKYKAPFGDPVCFDISGYNLALRKQEAKSIELY